MLHRGGVLTRPVVGLPASLVYGRCVCCIVPSLLKIRPRVSSGHGNKDWSVVDSRDRLFPPQQRRRDANVWRKRSYSRSRSISKISSNEAVQCLGGYPTSNPALHTSGTATPCTQQASYLSPVETMLRIADLLNHIGEDDNQLENASSQQVKLGRSVSAPERRSTRACDDRDGKDDNSEEEEEHSASCPEDKQSPRYIQTTPRLRSFSRSLGKTSMKRSPRRFSPYSSQQEAMTIRNLVNPSEPTIGSGVSFGPAKKAATASSGKKRSTRSLFPELTESERRAKQRLIVKRCYYKKINTIKSLRSEATSLEQRFRSALGAMQQEDEAAKAAGHAEDVKLRELFIDTLATKESLREENTRLRRLADEYYMKNQGRLRQLLDSNRKGLILFTAASND